jgi:hypothetical protein
MQITDTGHEDLRAFRHGLLNNPFSTYVMRMFITTVFGKNETHVLYTIRQFFSVNYPNVHYGKDIRRIEILCTYKPLVPVWISCHSFLFKTYLWTSPNIIPAQLIQAEGKSPPPR